MLTHDLSHGVLAADESERSRITCTLARDVRLISESLKQMLNCYSIGSLKFTHHFGWNCFFTLGEQLILQLWVTQSNNPSLPLSVASVLGAAALAAGDKLFGTARGATWGEAWGTTSVVGGAGLTGSS
jgi:hypothetical protein